MVSLVGGKLTAVEMMVPPDSPVQLPVHFPPPQMRVSRPLPSLHSRGPAVLPQKEGARDQTDLPDVQTLAWILPHHQMKVSRPLPSLRSWGPAVPPQNQGVSLWWEREVVFLTAAWLFF